MGRIVAQTVSPRSGPVGTDKRQHTETQAGAELQSYAKTSAVCKDEWHTSACSRGQMPAERDSTDAKSRCCT